MFALRPHSSDAVIVALDQANGVVCLHFGHTHQLALLLQGLGDVAEGTSPHLLWQESCAVFACKLVLLHACDLLLLLVACTHAFVVAAHCALLL